MNIPAIINEVESCGGVLAVIGGELKGKNLSQINETTLVKIKKNKAAIIRLIKEQDSTQIINDKQIPRRPQVNCQAYEATKILMATKSEYCIDQQGHHCGNCNLRENNITGE